MSEPRGRTCALCGHGQSPRRGGLAGFRTVVDFARARGVKLKQPHGGYLHIQCARRLQKGTQR